MKIKLKFLVGVAMAVGLVASVARANFITLNESFHWRWVDVRNSLEQLHAESVDELLVDMRTIRSLFASGDDIWLSPRELCDAYLAALEKNEIQHLRTCSEFMRGVVASNNAEYEGTKQLMEQYEKTARQAPRKPDMVFDWGLRVFQESMMWIGKTEDIAIVFENAGMRNGDTISASFNDFVQSCMTQLADHGGTLENCQDFVDASIRAYKHSVDMKLDEIRLKQVQSLDLMYHRLDK